MPVRVPNFAALVRAAPLERMKPVGMIAGPIIGNALAGISNSITENKQAKQSMLSFADIMGETDPQAAQMYRTMADSIPLFDPESASGGSARGAGGTGGGPRMGGMQGMVMKDMMDALGSQRDISAYQQKAMIGLGVDKEMENLRHSNDMREILGRGQVQETLIEQRNRFQAGLEELRTQKWSMERDLKIKQYELGISKFDEQISQNRKQTQEDSQRAQIAERNSQVGLVNALRPLAFPDQNSSAKKATPQDIANALARNPEIKRQHAEASKRLEGTTEVESGGKSFFKVPNPDERAAIQATLDRLESQALGGQDGISILDINKQVNGLLPPPNWK